MKIGVVCGGTSSEREVSLKSGAEVHAALDRKKFSVERIEIRKNGEWFLLPQAGGAEPIGLLSGDGRSLKEFDVLFLALHGKFGEDGRIQALLEMIGIPYTGSGVLASALAMDKRRALEIASPALAVPEWFALARMPKQEEIMSLHRKIHRSIGYPCVVKPNQAGSSVGISIVGGIADLPGALRTAFDEDDTVLVQEYMKGRELTCGVLGNAGQTELEPLPPVEIRTKRAFFDYKAKYESGAAEELCPAPLDGKETLELQRLACLAHERLGCDGLSRSDFIYARNRFWFMETNTIPGLTPASLCPKEAAAAGIPFPEFLARQIELALLRFGPKKRR